MRVRVTSEPGRAIRAQQREPLGHEWRGDCAGGRSPRRRLGRRSRLAGPDRDDRRARRRELALEPVDIPGEWPSGVEDERRQAERGRARPVSQVGRAEALGPQPGHLLELERRLERRRVGVAARDADRCLGREQRARRLLHERLRQRDRRRERGGERLQRSGQVRRAERARELGDDGQRRRERLGGGDRALLARGGDERMADRRRERRAGLVRERRRERPALRRELERGHDLRRLARLRDAQDERAGEIDRRAVVYSEGAARLAESAQRASSR